MRTRIPQARDDHLGIRAEPQQGSHRQLEEGHTARGDVLTHLTSADNKTGRGQFLMQLLVNEVHLTKVRLRGIARNPRAMFDCRACMTIALDAETGDQANPVTRCFAERMSGAHAYRDNRSHTALAFHLTRPDCPAKFNTVVPGKNFVVLRDHTVSCSPRVPGSRPSYSSDAGTRMCASIFRMVLLMAANSFVQGKRPLDLGNFC